MSGNLQDLVSQLEAAVAAGDVTKGKAVLAQAKMALLTSDNAALAAQALECGALISLADNGDLEAFARHLSLLLPYYLSGNAESPRKLLIMGLHLMHLLVEHRLSEFHSILEVVTEQEASTSPYLSFPIGLERQFMVGMYNDILEAIDNLQSLPDPSYQFFVDTYLKTAVRDSIADGLEVSYNSLSLQEAANLMKFDSVQQLQEYIQESRDDWIVEGEELLFSPADTAVTAADLAAPDWIQQSLQYATEMERIV